MAASNSPPRAVRATARVPVRRPARRTSQPSSALPNREKRRKRFRGGRGRRAPPGGGGGGGAGSAAARGEGRGEGGPGSGWQLAHGLRRAGVPTVPADPAGRQRAGWELVHAAGRRAEESPFGGDGWSFWAAPF